MINPAPAPEGVLDPQQPWWPTANMRDNSWDVLKAKLTGRRMPDGTQYETWVHLPEGDADRLIANIKKYGKYPQVNQTGGQGGYENLAAYQKWLVEEFLEKPFRDETNKKIEEAEQNARIEELRKQAEKNKQTVIIKNQEVPLADVYKQAEEGIQPEESIDDDSEQKELDNDQEVLEKEIDKITVDLDSVDNQSKDVDNSTEDKKDDEVINSDFDKIKTSLEGIQGSLSIQASDLNQLNINTANSVGSLSGIKDLFKIKTDILKKKLDDSENKLKETSLEKNAGKISSGDVESVSTTASMQAEGVVQEVSGKTVTVAPTSGVFVKGQKITQGGGGGLSSILGGIGKLFGGGGGGGAGGEGASAAVGALTKLSGGGFLNTSYPAYAEGTIAPGVYNKPTRGQLAPGQAVIPLNRNVGKQLLGANSPNQTKLGKFNQPLIDVMSQPLRAVGVSIIATVGNFIRALGPLGGFFMPYVTGIIGDLSKALDVPSNILLNLIAGPAYGAEQEQKKQQNIFAEIWSNIMKTLGFNFGGEDSNTDNTKDQTQPAGNPNFEGSEGGEKTMNFLMSQGLSPQQAAGVAGNLMQESHFDPNADNGSHHGIAQWDKQDRWPRVSAYITSIGKDPNTLEGQLMGLKWEADKRGDWKQIQQTKTAQDAAQKWLERFEISGEKPGMPGFDNRLSNANGLLAKYGKVSAESGIQMNTGSSSLGDLQDFKIIDGPNSGYDINNNLKMHGTEAFLQHENGFSILPIENNKFSMQKDPLRTISRWEQILKSGPSKKKGYETGGKGLSTRGVQAGFTGMNKQGFDAIMGGDKFRLGAWKPQILGRGAYSAPTMKGAMRYAGTSGSLGGRQTAGGVVKSIVPGGARRINFLEPQAAVAPRTFDKGKQLADKLLSGKYANSPLANKLRAQLITGSARSAGSLGKFAGGLLKLGGRALEIGNLPVIGDMLFPESTSEYDQVSGPNAYYNAPGYKGKKPVPAAGAATTHHPVKIINMPVSSGKRKTVSSGSGSGTTVSSTDISKVSNRTTKTVHDVMNDMSLISFC